MFALNYGNLSVLTTYSLLGGTAIIGKFLFREKINKAQRIGLSFTVAGILCLLVASLANI